jgi:hypothetical protein
MFLISRREPPDAEDLRCEYAAAEAHVATLTAVVMQSAAIVVGGSFAALALLIQAKFTYPVAIGVSVLGVLVIVLIEMWRHNWRRHKRSIDNHWVRMRQIEHERGMWANIYAYLLTIKERDRKCKPEWKWLSEEERKCFPKPYKEFPEPRCITGQCVLRCMACLVQVGWVAMIAFAWFEAVRNQGAAHACLGWATW